MGRTDKGIRSESFLGREGGAVHESGSQRSQSVPKSAEGWSTINSEVPIRRSPQQRFLPPSESEAGFLQPSRRCAYSVSSRDIRRDGYQSKRRVEIRIEILHTAAASEQSEKDLSERDTSIQSTASVARIPDAACRDLIAPISRLPFRVASAWRPNPKPQPPSPWSFV